MRLQCFQAASVTRDHPGGPPDESRPEVYHIGGTPDDKGQGATRLVGRGVGVPGTQQHQFGDFRIGEIALRPGGLIAQAQEHHK